MNKIKIFALCAAYIVMAIISIPIIIIGLICALFAYGVVRLETIIIRKIDDEELTDAWNKVAETFYDCADSANKELLMEIEL